MGLKTAMGEGFPTWQGNTVNLRKLVGAIAVEAKGQNPRYLLSVGDMPLQSL